MNSNVVWKTVWILSSWLPSLLFHTVSDFISGFSTVKTKLSSLCVICSLGQENFFVGQEHVCVYYNHLLVPGQVSHFTTFVFPKH